ncbi:MAG TPA: alpha-1,4-glucan--maltose-1-phosphate maltosyltransferase [Caulobacteraceae bacterium]|nr:alpha-1,4-glucan--maltose-1-phosphate maltosyltransferase [Caulobacteraceae bacterium]
MALARAPTGTLQIESLAEVADAIASAKAMGLDAILARIPSSQNENEALKDFARACAAHSLAALLDIAFIERRGAWAPVDPRQPVAREPGSGCYASLEGVAALAALGVRGVRLPLRAATSTYWRELISTARAALPGFLLLGDAAGAGRDRLGALAGVGLDGVTSSLPWWDGRARWLTEEHEILRAIGPVISPLGRRGQGAPAGCAADSPASRLARLMLAAALDERVLVSAGYERGDGFEFCADIRAAGVVGAELGALQGDLRFLTSAGAPVTALLRADRAQIRDSERALLVLVNPDGSNPVAVAPADFLGALGVDYDNFERLGGDGEAFGQLAAAEVRLVMARRARLVRQRPAPQRGAVIAATEASRVTIEDVQPRVDGGPFAVKAIVGERLEVSADVFAEGHSTLGVELLWRPVDRPGWRSAPMAALGNDRWSGGFELQRLGRWEFCIEAWFDLFGAFAEGFAKKLAAGVAEDVDVAEGRAIVAAAQKRSEGRTAAALQNLLDRLDAGSTEARAALLTAPQTRALMRQADDRRWRRRSDVQAVDAERLSARYGSWYELFPRSQSGSPDRHGTFDDVIARLPGIRAMGFDVLYLPPIHPIGRTGRKGKDNSLTAGPDDPGSPYAIGAAEGGHETVHPDLGGLEGFRRLIEAAGEHGLEVALDFAIQCSPDHPWLTQHPDWFDWRPDGSLKFAENPPKKYEDIVNVDFYAAGALPSLWLALRDVVLFWVREGVRIFRVDNPHTKPLPFWEWLIADVRRAYPDMIFLAEAFTRPKLMYRLAKLGFSQSYTYFTWRHGKREFTDYLTELTQGPPRTFFRPHFFVNTPDINPYFLQHSGRAGFLIRAALAATLSGLWGVYSGFELLEADPVPGKEEYRASEKYEIKPRDWNAPGNIKAEIAALNRIRRGEPALQTHLNVRFYNAFNDQVLYYGKRSPGGADMILVAVSLDPHNAQSADIEVPLWEWGLKDDGAVSVADLVRDRGWIWRGKHQRISLSPEHPYEIWRIQPVADA